MFASWNSAIWSLTRTYQPGAIDFGPDFRQIGPMHSAGRAELIVEHRGHHQDVEDIRLVGNVEAHLEFSCARCLEPVAHDVDKAFDLIYRPQGVDRRAARSGDQRG